MATQLNWQPVYRTSRRSRGRVVVRLRTEGISGADYRRLGLLDLSATGCRAEVEGELAVGEQIQLGFPDGYVAVSEVVWTHGGIAGFCFLECLPKVTLSAARLKSDHTPAGRSQAPERPENPLEFSQDPGFAPDDEKLPSGYQILINLALIASPWAVGLGIALAV